MVDSSRGSAVPTIVAGKCFPGTDVLVPANYGEAFKSTPGPSLEESTSAKRPLRGRPPGSNKRAKITAGAGKSVKARRRRATDADLIDDVWFNILQYCDPKILFEARNFNHRFRKILSYEHVWRQCRLNHYGPDCPDPPAGLREWEYLDLLYRQGCQSCQRKPRTRKVFWAFKRRWCKDCYREKTMRECDAFATLPDMLKNDVFGKCVPYAYADSFYAYEGAGENPETWRAGGRGRQKIVLKSDVTRMLLWYETLTREMRDLPTDQQDFFTYELDQMSNSVAGRLCRNARQAPGLLNQLGQARTSKELFVKVALFACMKNENQRHMDELNWVEDWLQMEMERRHQRNGDYREQRVGFYQEKASLMDPPVNSEVLEEIEAYQNAIRLPKPPTEASWRALEPKILANRTAAEHKVEWDRLQQVSFLHRMALKAYKTREVLKENRTGFIYDLAEEVVQDMLQTYSHRYIDAQDFVLLTLISIREKFDQLPDDKIPDTPREYGFYSDCKLRLSVHDMFQVLANKIYPVIDARFPQQEAQRARMFKCPGCSRSDTNKRWRLMQLHMHIGTKHATGTGSFARFSTCNSDVNLVIEWPRNPFFLADHQKATGTWDPDDVSNYQLAPPPATLANLSTSSLSAFAWRVAQPFPFEESAAMQHAEGYPTRFMLAWTLMPPEGLPSRSRFAVAHRYALEIFSAKQHKRTPKAIIPEDPDPPVHLVDPPDSAYHALELLLIRQGHHSLLGQMRCRTCQDSTNAHADFNRTHGRPRGISELARHFERWHATKHHKLSSDSKKKRWTVDMIDLPDGKQLHDELHRPGAEKSLEMFERLFRPASEEEIQARSRSRQRPFGTDGKGDHDRSVAGKFPGDVRSIPRKLDASQIDPALEDAT